MGALQVARRLAEFRAAMIMHLNFATISEGAGAVRRRREEDAVTVRNYLLAVSGLAARSPTNPRLVPSFVLMVAMMPKTLQLAGAARTKRIAARG